MLGIRHFWLGVHMGGLIWIWDGALMHSLLAGWESILLKFCIYKTDREYHKFPRSSENPLH